jgi:hypothetical protein
MTHETTTTLAPEDVLRRAKEFFATRVPATGAFVEKESERHVVLRGQGGEEVVIAVAALPSGTVVRGSVDRNALAKRMGLRPDQKIVLAQTVGYPQK